MQRMQSGDEQAQAAHQLLAGTYRAVLSTHSLDLEGYPFGSVVPYACGRDGLPLLLLSHLSQHTKNLVADARCGFTVVEHGDGDVQQLARLSGLGRVVPCEENGDAGRYFAYFPQSRMYFEELNFHFFRFVPERFHWNGGFATARWFSPDRIVRTNPFDAATEQRICSHMNEDHADALRGYLGARLAADAEAVVMCGIDSEGMDLRSGDRLFRVPFERSIADAKDAREILVEMAGGH